MNNNKRFAYCTVITNNNYTPCILLNQKFFNYFNSKYPFIVLVTNNVSKKTINLLKEHDIIVKYTKYFTINYDDDDVYHAHYKDISMIYSPLSLTEYDKILFFEADVLLMDNYDYFIEKQKIDKYKNFCFPILNKPNLKNRIFKIPDTTIYLCKPNLNIYNNIINIYNTLDIDSDHEIAIKFYNNCIDENMSKINFIHFYGFIKLWQIKNIPWISNFFYNASIKEIYNFILKNIGHIELLIDNLCNEPEKNFKVLMNEIKKMNYPEF